MLLWLALLCQKPRRWLNLAQQFSKALLNLKPLPVRACFVSIDVKSYDALGWHRI